MTQTPQVLDLIYIVDVISFSNRKGNVVTHSHRDEMVFGIVTKMMKDSKDEVTSFIMKIIPTNDYTRRIYFKESGNHIKKDFIILENKSKVGIIAEIKEKFPEVFL